MRSQELEERIFKFVKRLLKLVRRLSKNQINREYGTQVIRAGGSIGSNYCEATEADSRKDFVRRIKICKREAKETKYWLRLLKFANSGVDEDEFDWLINEAYEYVLIFSSTIQTARKRK
jgi:four helix bundle protein